MSNLPRLARGSWLMRLYRSLVPRRSDRVFRPSLAILEGRQLLSSMPVPPSAEEQYMLQLINRARANPPAEAARIVALTKTDATLRDATKGVDLSAFIRQSSAVAPLPPLAFNTRLIAAARDQDAAMLAANDQTHAPAGFLVTGAGGRVAGDGKVYFPTGQSQWATGENVFAFTRNVTRPALRDYVDYLHAGLLIDWGNPDFGHLKNIYAPGPSTASARGQLPFSEIGIGLLSNANPTAPPASNPEYPANKGLNVGPVILTQEFAWKSGNASLTGAIYRDVDGDNFYSPGEGIGGVSIQAVGTRGEGTYQVGTWGSGGYALALPPGSYNVTATGTSISTRSTVITIGKDNVGWDLSYANSTSADQPVPADYDGDGKVDIAAYHASTSQWYIKGTASTPRAVTFGQPNDVPVPADYDGDGKVDLAVYRPSNGQWHIQGSTSGLRVVQFGSPGLDQPVPGDYDGDGKADLAIYRPSQGVWFLQQSKAGPRGIALGKPNVDLPIPGDYDGDGKADFATYRPTTGEWLIIGTSSVGKIVQLGKPGIDVPVPGDYDGDRKTDYAVYRNTTAEWLIVGTNSVGRIVQMGQANVDAAVPADYDGDRRLDIAVFRPTSATWYAQKTREGGSAVQFGHAGSGTPLTALRTAAVTNYGVASPRWVASPAASSAHGKKAAHPKGPRPIRRRAIQARLAKLARISNAATAYADPSKLCGCGTTTA